MQCLIKQPFLSESLEALSGPEEDVGLLEKIGEEGDEEAALRGNC